MLVQQNQLDQAKSEVTDLVRRMPSSVQALNLLGMIQARQQDFEGAVASYQSALKISPRSTRTLINLGALYLTERRPEMAEKEFRKALVLEPGNRDAHYNLGVLMSMKGAPAAAIEQFLQVHPADQPTRFQLAGAYFENQQPAQALKVANELSLDSPRDAAVHFSLGVLLASKKQYKAAEFELEKADALQPSTFEILYNLGQDLLRGGENAKAEAVLTRALRAHPDSVDTLYLMGQVYTNESRPLDALDILLRARKLAPENIDVLFLMAQVSMSQNYYEDAIPLLESGIQLAPHRPDLVAALGESYFMAGKTDKAIEEFNQLIKLEGSGRSYVFLGLSYRNLGRYDDAKRTFQQGLTLDPKNSLCIFNLGFIAERQGDSASAESYFQKALQLNPDLPDALLELANLRIASRNFKEATDFLRRYVRVSRDPATGYYKLAMAERSLHDAAAADRDLGVFKTLSRNSASGPYPYQHLFDYLDNRSKLPDSAREQLDIEQLTTHIKEHPDSAEDLHLLAEAYLKTGRIEEAKDAISRLDKISEKDFRTLAGAGVLLARYHIYDSAIAHFKEALQSNPTSDDVKFDLADALFRSRHYPEALEAAGQVSAEGRKDDAYLALLGDIYAHLGDADRATQIYRDAISRNPDNDQYYLSLALIQLRTGDAEGARQTLLKGLSRTPGSGKIYWGLGLVSSLQGKDTDAAAQLERAVELIPEWPGVYSTLGVFYFQRGQIDKAKDVLKRFKSSSANASLDVDSIEQAVDRASEGPAHPDDAMTTAKREQLLQLALALADRTL